jgi:uncharacterized membrane protein
MALSLALHTLAAVIWVGGMLFIYVVLRPSTAAIDTETHVTLWHRVLSRYFTWVWFSIISLLGSGFAMVFFDFGGLTGLRLYIRAMMMIGTTMMALYLWLYCAPWRRFRQAFQATDWSAAERDLRRIRTFVGVSLVLGLINVVVGASGRYLF